MLKVFQTYIILLCVENDKMIFKILASSAYAYGKQS